MTVLELHIAGPGLNAARRLAQGDEALILGRDPECDVCLPDPERGVSRRHLSLWVANGELNFHVLSVVNGIEMPFGEAPPGARGVLLPGHALRVGDYSVRSSVLEADTPAPAAADPWSALAAARQPEPPAAQEDDPFGDWGFETTFGPGANGGGPLDANDLEPGDARAFFRGLGMDANGPGAMTRGELEDMGRLVRVLVLGVLDLHASVAGVRQDMRSGDRTTLAPRDNNPLKSDWPAETKLRYLFGGRLAAAGLAPPERAVRELLVDLVTHNAASGAATHSAIVSILKEFAPAALKARLLADAPRLFESARAWDAYGKYHEEQAVDIAAWSQRLLEKYFTDAYLRESTRVRRETRPRAP